MIPKYIEKKMKQKNKYIALVGKLQSEINEWCSKTLNDSNLSDEDAEEIDCDNLTLANKK